MKIRMITAFMSFALLCPFYVVASDFEDESFPIEQDYVQPIDQLNDDSASSSFEAGPAPIEQGYVKSLDQIDDESMSSSFGGESIPVE
jgi:hypothetical protein